MTVVSDRVAVESFEGFVESALPRLVRFAAWVGGPSGDPEDLVQEALVRVGSRWPDISTRARDPEAYVRQAIVNGHVSRWRARRRERLVDVLPEPGGRDTGPIALRHTASWQAVASLPRGQRAVVALRFFEDMSVSETAQVLGVSEGTVKTQTHRALESLRHTLGSRTAGVDDAGLVAITQVASDEQPALIARPRAGAQVAAAVRARRRIVSAAVTGAVTSGLALLIALVVWSPWSGGDRIQPVVPAPSVRESPAPVTEATPVPSGGPSAPNATPPSQSAAATREAFPANTDIDTGTATGGPVLFTDLRVGRQAGFDRVVWEFAGDGLPGWRASYSDDPRREGSGDRVDLSGNATLAVTIMGVGLPDSVDVPPGTTEYDGAGQVASADTELVTEVIAGAWFEGYQDGFVGVDSEVPFRVYRLEDPTRIVLEVRTG